MARGTIHIRGKGVATADERPSKAAKETKEAAFKRIGTRRVNEAKEKIRLISNLAGPSYVYTDKQVSKLFAELQRALDAAKEEFEKTAKPEERFSL